ncbi:GPI mannosyltransferase 3 isoform X1 [Vigna radiata var. radiata]|uniref:Mannosyltransferase n=2 Tax=Vigna radiata var. radiata TaxID=3916 RepID=A0A1S3UTS3_VIGRR|nr:GPI mannosyltransferase 3 isoform X1 [Vigna radiata var. radiata]
MRQRHNSNKDADKQKSEALTSSKSGSEHSPFCCSHKRIFLLCLAFRMVNSVLVQTYFNPDEHWQGPEVAHRVAFGYGHLTWEWKQGIRSYLHPLFFVPLYRLLALLHLDTPWLMMRAPRLLQSVFSAIGDLYLYKLSEVLFGDSVAKWTLFSQLFNWFMFYCFSRTLSNSLETVLTLVSLYFWPCMRSSSNYSFVSRKWGLVMAAVACAIRPTSAITWLYVGLLELLKARDRFKFIFLEVAPIGILVLGLTCLLDRFMYGTWVLVPLNFLKFNFLSSGGDYYGTHKWHWYFTQGFTVMVLSYLPFCIAGIIYSKQWKFSGLLAWVLGFYSLLGHKEFRFVLPVLPIALMFSGYSLAAIEDPGSARYKGKESSKSHTRCPGKMKIAILFLLATNIPMALYMSLVHQRGPEDVMNHLAREALHGKVRSILFLTPCHATPYYSMLHHDLPMQFLDCTPSEEKGVPDDSDRFLMDPVSFVSEYAKNVSMASHIVLFDSEEQKLKNLLISFDYMEGRRFFNAHFKVDRDLQASVVVYVRRR